MMLVMMMVMTHREAEHDDCLVIAVVTLSLTITTLVGMMVTNMIILMDADAASTRGEVLEAMTTKANGNCGRR